MRTNLRLVFITILLAAVVWFGWPDVSAAVQEEAWHQVAGR